MNLWGAFVGVIGTDRRADRLLGGIMGVETRGTGLIAETGGRSITDERGISTGWGRGVRGGGITLRCLCV
jgi:hypothetical protein